MPTSRLFNEDVVKPSDHVLLSGMTIVVDLGFHRHVSNVCKTCLFWLRRLRHRSLDIESVKTYIGLLITGNLFWW